MRSFASLCRVAAAAAALALAAPTPAAQQFINVLTGGTSGVYYPLGVALGGIIGKAIPDAKTSVQATKASVENLNLLQAGRGEIAFTLGDSLSDAWKGNEEAGFKAPLKAWSSAGGASGRGASVGIGASTTRRKVASSLSARKREAPLTASKRRMPREKISLR